MNPQRDTVDIGEAVGVLRRRWRWVVAGVLTGLLLAIVVGFVFGPRYKGRTTVVLRSAQAGQGGALGGEATGILSAGSLASLLSGATGFDTELEILTSRSTIGAVVDSLGLQAIVEAPEALPRTALFSSARWDPLTRESVYHFERSGSGYRVIGPGASGSARPGVAYRLGRSIVTLRSGGLPERFVVRVISREQAIDRFEKRLDAEQASGDVAEITYHADDPIAAAAAPNALVQKYLERRRTTDRGVNQRRYEFLAERTDSVRADLGRAEDALRAQQERSGMLDPGAFGDAELERGMELRTDLDEAQVEERAFREVLNQVAAGSLSARALAAYPTLLGNPAINEILARLQSLENQRTELLDRRTPRDPDVIVLTEQIRQLEDRLVALSRSYLDGVSRREAQLRSELSGYHEVLARLPAQAEAHYRLDREVRRLSETLVAMQTQLVQARLAAITEGGEARPVDTAVPPRKPAFPRPLLNLAIGLIGGLVLGMVGALGSHYLGNGVADPREAELASGAPVVRLDSRMPLLLKGAGAQQSVLVVPVNEHASSLPVARRIASTAALQGVSVVLAILGDAALDRLPADAGAETGVALAPLESEHADPLERAETGDGSGYPVYHGSRNGGSGAGARTALEELERRFSLVVAALPPLGHVSVTALLSMGRPVVAVATAGRVTRTELREMTGSLATAGIPLAGVVLRDGRGGDDSSA